MKDVLNDIKIIKNGKNVTNQQLSKLSGVPLGTVNKILSGATKSVKSETLEKLNSALLNSSPVCATENFGFIKVGAHTLEVILASPKKNAEIIVEAIVKATKKGVSLLCFPKLSLTGSTLGSLFYQTTLLNSAVKIWK